MQNRRRNFLMNLIFPSLMFLITCTIADGSQNNQMSFRLVGQIGGPTQGIAVQGNYAYVGVGLRLVVLDVSNPASLQEVGATTPFPYFVEDVAVSGDLAYVAAGGSGLRVVDISDPFHPTELGAWDSRGYAEGVAVAGNIVYLADGPYGLRVVDVSNPAMPTEIGSAFPMNYTFKVAVDGQYAYIAAAGAGLLIADVSDPRHPVEVGTYDTPGCAYGVTVAGNTVYVADGWEGLKIVDVSTKNSPHLIGQYKTPGWAFGVAISGPLAYVADAFKGLRVLDVSTPSNPSELGSYEVFRGHAGSVVVAGSMAYVADRNWGLRAVDISNSTRPIPLGTYAPLSDAWDVIVTGNYAYVSAQYYGLQIVDISDPAHPVQVGAYDADGLVIGTKVVGNYAYLAVGGGKPGAGLHVVDVSNPALPKRVGFIAISPDVGLDDNRFGIPRDIEVAGEIAYVTNEQGMLLISVSDPAHPAVLGFIMIEPWGPATVGLAVSGTRAFVVKQTRGLAIVDVSNPYTPTLMGVYNLTDIALDTDVSGNLAFVVNRSDGILRIVDVSDSSHPVTLGSCGLFSNAVGVTALGTLVYIGDGEGGIKVVDVSSPSIPTLVGIYNTPDYARKVAVAGNYAYVADGAGGLLILEKVGINSTTNLQIDVDNKRIRSIKQSNPIVLPSISRLRVMTQALSTNNLGQPSHHEKHITRKFPLAQGDHRVHFVSRESSSRTAGTCIVTNTADSGQGTLRECLENAVSGDAITFDSSVFSPNNSAQIVLNSGLPTLTQGDLIIDASNAGVILHGDLTPDGTDGLVITSNGNTIKGLQIMYFHGGGVVIREGAKGNTIGGDRTQGSGPMGEGNLISGNRRGMFIYGSGTDDNVVIGNYFGTNISGMVPISNHDTCIAIGDGAQRNTIGGTTAGGRNIISGCGGPHGVLLYGTSTMHNTLIGNYMGTDASGMALLGPASCVSIIKGAAHNRIEKNIISGSGREGVAISDNETTGNAIVGNYIGTNASGTAALSNALFGVWVQFGAYNNVIQQNLISGNSWAGVAITDWGCDYNVVIGNLIGTDASGIAALGNDGGVLVSLGSKFNRIGGTAPGERNVISGNHGWGNIWLGGRGGEGNLVLGNYIGTDISGTEAISVTPQGAAPQNGINLGGDDARHSFVGGMTEVERNIIAGNAGSGVNIGGSGVEYNFIAGNYIGTDASGSIAISNEGDGIKIDGAEHNVIQNNTIAHNTEFGIRVQSSAFNTIRSNSIHNNTQKGIANTNGGNGMLPAPIINAFTFTSISGTACPECTVEVFSDTEDEGQVYEGSTIANASGVFTFNKGSPLIGPNITATATDNSGNTSEFSTLKTVTESISTPNTPSGPVTGTIDTNYRYSTGGSTSSLGHDVQYLINWGDGTDSGWLSVGATSATKKWGIAGNFGVKAQARCAVDPNVISPLSPTLDINISVPAETVSIPNTPSGPASGMTGVSYNYSTGGSTSNLGHSLEYQFDWKGDGSDLSPWGSVSQSKSWNTSNINGVRARARCSQDVSIVSNWSNPLSVNIGLPPLSVTPLTYDFGNVSVKKSKTASFKVKNNGKADLLISTSITGTDVSMFTITSGGGVSKTIKPNKTLTIKVVFKPTSTGPKSSTLRITSNDPDTPTIDIPLTGTVPFSEKTPDISVAQTTLDFGSIKVGKKVTKTIKITNNGSGDLMITFSGLEETDFSVQGSSSVTIKAKKTYSLKILFTPKSVGFETTTLEVESNDPDTKKIDISLSGTGQ